MHYQDMQMSDVQSEAMPMEMADMEMESNADLHLDSGDHLTSDLISGGWSKHVTDEFVTQPIEPCSHCLMHTQSANAPLQTVTLNASSYESTVSDSSVLVLMVQRSLLSFVEVHDHGPPSSTIPRYVLVETFRI